MKTIASAKQTSSNRVEVYILDGSNVKYLSSLSGELVGFTSNTVTIRNGTRNEIYEFDGNRLRYVKSI